MAEDRVVIGNGPAALRAATALAQAGHKVTLLQGSETEAGLAHPEVAEGTGRLSVSHEGRSVVERVLGPLTEVGPPSRAVASGGKRYNLPLQRWQVPMLLPGKAVGAAAAQFTQTRTRNAMSELLGSGAEERTYKDWVVRRMGEVAYHHIYRAYAERRWGAAGDRLGASIARVHHGLAEPSSLSIPGRGPAAALQEAETALTRAGGTVRLGVEVTGLRVEAGRVVAVQTSQGDIAVDSAVWIARSPRTIIRWLGEAASSGVQVDVAELEVRTALDVVVRGDVSGLPDELHVLDEGAPFFRVVRPHGTTDVAVLQSNLAEGAEVPPARLVLDRFLTAARQLGVGDFSPDGAIVRALPEQDPVWLQISLSRMRRVLMAWQQLGVVGVGRAGSFRLLDPAEEIALAALYRDVADPDQREIHRAHFDPPVLQRDLGAHITRLIER